MGVEGVLRACAVGVGGEDGVATGVVVLDGAGGELGAVRANADGACYAAFFVEGEPGAHAGAAGELAACFGATVLPVLGVGAAKDGAADVVAVVAAADGPAALGESAGGVVAGPLADELAGLE